jgi:hypothetical protein
MFTRGCTLFVFIFLVYIADRAIRHRACALKDTAYAIIAAELDTDFGKLCEDICKARERRGMFHIIFFISVFPI